MASDAQIAANRKNAQRSTGPRTQEGKQCAALNSQGSTGPRTPEGKRRVARNALRHGLAALAQLDAALAGEMEGLAEVMAGLQPSAERRRRSQALAEAQLDLWRVRAARVGVIDRAAVQHAKERESVGAKPGPEPDAAEREAAAIQSALPQLVRLDRYERRALSRRKKAMQSLDELLQSEPDDAGP